MKISTEIRSAAQIVGEHKAVEYIAKAGFDAWDFTMVDMCKYDREEKSVLYTGHPLGGRDYLKFVRELKRIGIENGIKCNQSHAPFPVLNKTIFDHLKRAIECTAEAGGEICVIHPDNNSNAEQNAEIYYELLPFAKGCGVKIATENMYNWAIYPTLAGPAACSSHEDFKAHLDLVNDDYLVACVDIGHAEMKGLDTSAAEMLRYLGDKVQALHIHDNDLSFDSHQLPFSMNIDFEPIIKALSDINYNGYFTLEADRFLSDGGYNEENVLAGLRKMADVATQLANKFEMCRNNR